MHLHILGVCGTFMAGIAALASELGHRVTGSDANVYPPMSDQLAAQGIEIMEGYSPEHLRPFPDCVIVGNALSRGNPAVEYILNEGLTYTSGPAWLKEHVLQGRWTLAVSGTHGKTTTSSMLSWILEHAGQTPGFLVGGVPQNFEVSARLGRSKFFVIEADEYDTAFFDKRSKFVHYPARTVVITNLEHDHADIFPDLDAIRRQFSHFLRIVPGNGRVIVPVDDPQVSAVLAEGCWSEIESFGGGGDWSAVCTAPDGHHFEVLRHGHSTEREVHWDLIGKHNVTNGLAAIAAACHAGVSIEDSCRALTKFRNAKRRLEVIGKPAGITLYDDFAHHPSAIETTLEGLRASVGEARIIAIVEPRSNSMRLGLHKSTLGPSLDEADQIWLLSPREIAWDIHEVERTCAKPVHIVETVDEIIEAVCEISLPGDHIVIMSNGGFGGLHARLNGKLLEGVR